ncbi:hypothetical protein [Mycobacterium sp. 852002-51961_SCH5331710]|uniref:hypothetical protein n=1 Tax=Mycobacterium sp. 852002-51961_SCH5331710 TaxID=1834105 RepID=UPI000801837D|nr:hypothetical protein [Mycobacterium sp. 852002-51961_SCH5331710]OBB48409.1 hypothetical protein A5752_21335 [Mycobacterium sp. 852002-51961_SCH5331710]
MSVVKLGLAAAVVAGGCVAMGLATPPASADELTYTAQVRTTVREYMTYGQSVVLGDLACDTIATHGEYNREWYSGEGQTYATIARTQSVLGLEMSIPDVVALIDAADTHLC